MKNLIFYLCLIISLSFMTWFVFNQELCKVSKVITVSTSYRYLLEEDALYEVYLYTNDLKHPLIETSHHQITYLSDRQQNKKVEINIKKISIEYYEEHLKETYARLEIQYQVNFLASHITIEDAYLNISLTNDEFYTFYLGDIHFITQAENGTLNVKSLYGEKRNDVLYSRLKHVYVVFEEGEDIWIDSIMSAYNKNHVFYYENQVLQIEVDLEEKILHNLPFVIKYVKNNQTYEYHINNFRYIIEYETLKESGVLLNVYGLH
jgi:hypothetical protein